MVAAAALALAAAPTLWARVTQELAWRHIAGERTESGTLSTSFEMWYRPREALLLESVDGLTRSVRCSNGTLTEFDAVLGHTVTREGLSTAQCMAWATESLLSPDWTRGMSKASSGLSDGVEVERLVSVDDTAPYRVVEIRPADGLPVAVETIDGRSIRWSYAYIETTFDPPEVGVEADGRTFERYTILSRADTALALSDVVTVPSRVGDFVLDTSFTYVSDRLATRTYYIVWVTPDGRESQAVIGTGRLESSDLGLHDLGGQWILRAQLGERYLQLLAPDQAVMDAFRTRLDILEP